MYLLLTLFAVIVVTLLVLIKRRFGPESPGAPPIVCFDGSRFKAMKEFSKSTISSLEKARKLVIVSTVHALLTGAYFFLSTKQPSKRTYFLSSQETTLSDVRMSIQFSTAMCSLWIDSSSSKLSFLAWKDCNCCSTLILKS